jgi:IS30 family transposase
VKHAKIYTIDLRTKIPYLPKVNEKEVFKATDLMNNRPRKCLGYKTPFEVFAELTGKDYFLK